MSIGITDLLAPLGEFPIVEDTNVKGGYQSISDVSARDAIPANKRKVGMLVYTETTAELWVLYPGITNGSWSLYKGIANTLYETSGPTNLVIGTLTDGEYLKRVGSTVVSAALSGGTQTVQEEGVNQSTTVTTFNFTGAGVTASGGGATATINIPGGGTPLGGTTVARPVTPAQYTNYWDTTLGIPIWYVGVLWYNAAGVSV